MKSILIKSLLKGSFYKEHYPKYKLILNVFLFLSFFALTSSVVSLFIQYKVGIYEGYSAYIKKNKVYYSPLISKIDTGVLLIENKRNHLNNEEIYFSAIRRFVYKDESEKLDFNYNFRIKPLENSAYFLKTIKEDIEDYKKDYITDKKNWEENINLKLISKKNYEKLVSKIIKAEKDLVEVLKYYEFVNNQFLLDKNKYSKSDFWEIHKKVKNVLFSYMSLTQENGIFAKKLFTNMEKMSLNLSKEAARLSQLEQKLIFSAFIIQFIIFIFLQFFEIGRFEDEKEA